MGDWLAPFALGQLQGPQCESSSYPHSATVAAMISSFACFGAGVGVEGGGGGGVEVDENTVEKVETKESKIDVEAELSAVVKSMGKS